jgi:hypothetical protein
MGWQFPPAGGTGPIVRRANGCGVPRPRISALRFPLLGLRRVRNRQFGTTVRRDAPRGNAPPRLDKCMEKGWCRNCRTKHQRKQVTRDCFASLAMTWRWMPSLQGARSATKQSLPPGRSLMASRATLRFGGTNPRVVRSDILAKRTRGGWSTLMRSVAGRQHAAAGHSKGERHGARQSQGQL